jgi:hypothetical protein
MTKKLAVLLAFTLVVVLGCEVAASNSATSSSSTSATAYILSPSNNVVAASVSRNAEGVSSSAALEEFQMPTVWAVAPKDSSNVYHVYNKVVDPITADAASYVLVAGVYYTKYVKIGTKIFTMSTASAAYVAPDGTTLPSSDLSVADRIWYVQQMSAGKYSLLDSTQAVQTGIDYTQTATGVVAGATKSNRWVRSFNDPAWAAQRNAAVKFVNGRILKNVDADTLLSTDPQRVATIASVKGGIWYLWNDATGVANSPAWNFPTYLGTFVTAYNGGNATGSTTTIGNGGTTSGGGTDATSGATTP